jgi:hypothetical protein
VKRKKEWGPRIGEMEGYDWMEGWGEGRGIKMEGTDRSRWKDRNESENGTEEKVGSCKYEWTKGWTWMDGW